MVPEQIAEHKTYTIVKYYKTQMLMLIKLQSYDAEQLCLSSFECPPVYIADQFQFGFKKGHSTRLCTSTFKNTVDYYRCRVSHVFYVL